MARKWQYHVTTVTPVGHDSPLAGPDEWQDWLNRYDERGWEFVGPVYRHWRDRDTPQQFYVFRKPFKK